MKVASVVYTNRDYTSTLYKIGRSVDPEKRRKQHSKRFGLDCKIVKTWPVNDTKKWERILRNMTRRYEADFLTPMR